jgi:hypothetical protein
MEPLEVLTLPLANSNLYLRVLLRELFLVPTTADTIDENNRLYYCLWNASATGTINDNDAAPTVATITLLRLLKEVLLCLNSAQPSAVDTTYTFTFTNGTAGSADYTTTYSNRTGCYYGNCGTNNC